MNLEFIDVSIVVAYFVLIIFTGFYLSRNKEKGVSADEDFILAGRKVTLPFFVASLVATWYGGILGVGEFVYSSGIVAWVCFGLPYYIAGGFFAVFLASKIRNANVKTIPEQLRLKFGNRVGSLSSIIILVITIPATYILMLGVLISMFSGLSLFVSIIIGTILSMAYLFTGGFKADVYTNMAQFIIMYVGFGALIYFTMSEFGSLTTMFDKLPEHFLSPKGEHSWQYVIAWFIIAMQTFVDPSFHQRCSAAKTPKTARNGVLISVLFWIIFDAFTLFSGLYAKAYFEIDNPLMAYPVLGDAVLPVIWKGVFVTAMLATVMSTLDSYAFISATTIGNDILKPVFFKNKSISIKSLTKIGLLITGVIGLSLAILLPSVVQLIYSTASIAVPGLLVPLVVSMSKNYKINQKDVLIIMFFSSVIALIWLFLKNYEILFFKEIEPMLPAIAFSLIYGFFKIEKIEKQ